MIDLMIQIKFIRKIFTGRVFFMNVMNGALELNSWDKNILEYPISNACVRNLD